jgi:hypothetical protein
MQVSAGEIISADGSKPERRPGGFSYQLDGGSKSFLLLNPGWANGGADMEKPRGISSATMIDKVPVGISISDWEGRVIPGDQASRPPAANVQTKYQSVNTSGATQSIFDGKRTVELRANFTLDQVPKGGLSLNFNAIDDDGWIYVNGKFVGETHDWASPWSFSITNKVHVGENQLVVVVKNTDGPGGINGAATIGAPAFGGKRLGLEWTNSFVPKGSSNYSLDSTSPLQRIEHPRLSGDRPKGNLLVRSKITFAKPNFGSNATEIVLSAGGDGFLTLNGKGLGRYWEVGPQRAYFIPRNWMKDQNVLEYTCTPGRLGDRIKAAELRALKMVE